MTRSRVQPELWQFEEFFNFPNMCNCIFYFFRIKQLNIKFKFSHRQKAHRCQHLRSASKWKMIVPRYRMDSYGRRRCFAVAAPSAWNSVSDSLLDLALSLSIFRRHLKTHIFSKYSRDILSALNFFMRMRYIKLHFTYLLTYLLTWLKTKRVVWFNDRQDTSSRFWYRQRQVKRKREKKV